MIRALRILSRVAVVCAGLAFLTIWWVGRVPEPQSQTAIVGNIDQILIEKQSRSMKLYQDGKLIRQYRIALGFAPDGDKIRQGMARPRSAATRLIGAMPTAATPFLLA